MTTIDVIQGRIRDTMRTTLLAGIDPVPMLGFCRGEVDLGIISGPAMPPSKDERLLVFESFAAFLSVYGATEAVYVVDVARSSDHLQPNTDPDATFALWYYRLPGGQRYVEPYICDDEDVLFGPVEEDPRSVWAGGKNEFKVLETGLGWAPQQLLLRQAAPMWLQEKVPGLTLGLMPIAVN